MNATKFDPATRWRVEFRSPHGRRWVTLGTLGSHAQAQAWLARFYGSGDYRVGRPVRAEAVTHAAL